MENQVASKPKKKRKRVKTNLTTSKKSKRYRASKLAIKHAAMEHNLSTSSIDTDFCDSSDSVQTSETESVKNPQKITNLSNFNLKFKRSMRDNSTQVRIAKRNCSIQHSPHMRSKSAQTFTDKIKTSSRSTQYSSPSQMSSNRKKLLNMLNETDAFSKFADIIDSSRQTNKFVKCVQSIASGTSGNY